jgi:solute carrier family 13 (sodium-dependent dicarboxylate transporter), member 2/3/5
LTRVGFWLGAGLFALFWLVEPPAGLSIAGWRTAAVAVLMACWWFTEAVPVTLTGSLPFLLLPLLGVGTAETVAGQYMTPVLFLVLGGALIGLSFEKWDLHRRVALAVIRRTSPVPSRLLFAVLGVSALVSMWVNNSAATVMMLPIASAVLVAATRAHGGADASADTRRFGAAMVLAVAFGSNIGGFSTPIGTPVNAIAIGVLDRTFDVQISFAQWLAFGVPIMLLALPVTWWLLARVALRFDLPAASAQEVHAAIGDPGPLGPPERRVIGIVAATSIAWVTVPLLAQWIPGITDAGIAVAGALALCVIPAGDVRTPARGRYLLEWSEARQAPWYLILLLGGGVALADAVVKSGLGIWMSTALGGLSALPLIALLVIVTAQCILVTECASNVATATTFMPIAGTLALGGGYDPTVLALAAGLAASWGFANPAGTSSNAMVFGTGRVRIPEMLRAGLLVDLLGMVLIAAACYVIVPRLGL